MSNILYPAEQGDKKWFFEEDLICNIALRENSFKKMFFSASLLGAYKNIAFLRFYLQESSPLPESRNSMMILVEGVDLLIVTTGP